MRDPQEHDGITLHELVAERLVALVPEDHPAANGSHVAPAVLAASPLILYPRAAGAYAFAVNTRPLRDAGIDVQAAQECSHWQTIIALVAAGLGVTIAPYSVTALLPAGVRRLELDAPKYESRIFLATRCGDDRPLVQALTAASRDGVRHV